MQMFEKIRSFFSRRDSGNRSAPVESPTVRSDIDVASDCDRGFLVFEHTGEVMRAEQILKEAGFSVEIKGPPPELRSGCDMVIEFHLLEEFAVMNTLDAGKVHPLSVVPVHGTLLEPVSLFQTRDYGQWIMVRAANMKITVEKESGIIVNVSGGGCPDVPYLAASLVGKKLWGPDAASEPRDIGHTLCGYALQLAYQEVKRLLS